MTDEEITDLISGKNSDLDKEEYIPADNTNLDREKFFFVELLKVWRSLSHEERCKGICIAFENKHYQIDYLR